MKKFSPITPGIIQRMENTYVDEVVNFVWIFGDGPFPLHYGVATERDVDGDLIAGHFNFSAWAEHLFSKEAKREWEPILRHYLDRMDHGRVSTDKPDTILCRQFIRIFRKYRPKGET